MSDETAITIPGALGKFTFFTGTGRHRVQIVYFFRMQIGSRTPSRTGLGSGSRQHRKRRFLWLSRELWIQNFGKPWSRAIERKGTCLYVCIDGSRRTCGVGDYTCLVSTLGESREASGPRIDRIPPTRPPRWRRHCRELKKLYFRPPSKCPIDLFGPLANGTILKRLRRVPSFASILHDASSSAVLKIAFVRFITRVSHSAKLYIAAVYRCREARTIKTASIDQCPQESCTQESTSLHAATRASTNIAARHRREQQQLNTRNGRRQPKVHRRGEGAPRRAGERKGSEKKGAPEAEEGPDKTTTSTTRYERRPQDV